jgi:hypothetical protein
MVTDGTPRIVEVAGASAYSPPTRPPIPNPEARRRLSNVANNPGGRALHWRAIRTGGDAPAEHPAPKRSGLAWCASRPGRRRVTAFYPARFERPSYEEPIPQYTPHRAQPLKNFHSPIVTSDLAPKIKSRNHSRGRDSRVNPHRRASKSFVSRILVRKFFDIRILRGISC